MNERADTALLEVLADCLEAGESLTDALGKVAIAGGAALLWTQRIARCARPELSVAAVLHAARVLDDVELSLVSTDAAQARIAPLLRAVVVRRRRSRARQLAVARGLLAPLAFALLTIVLNPLMNLMNGGDYLWPVARDLFLLGVFLLVCLLGVRALSGGGRTRGLRFCSAVPGVRWLTQLYAEEELVTVLLPFASAGELSSDGIAAAASFVSWSPLAGPLGAAMNSRRAASGTLPMGGLAPVAGTLSLATSLSIVGGCETSTLPGRLAARGDDIASILTARLRMAVRTSAYSLLVLFSLGTLIGLFSRALPGMPTLPGGTASPDQKEIEQLMKQLE